MILDNRALLSDKQAITATAVSTNVYDLLETGVMYDGVQIQRNLGKAGYIPFLVQVNEDFNTLTSLTFEFQTSDTEVFTVATSVFAVTVPLAQLKAGFILPIDKIPRGLMQRYFRMNYTVAGTAPTTGSVTAGVVAAVDGSYQG